MTSKNILLVMNSRQSNISSLHKYEQKGFIFIFVVWTVLYVFFILCTVHLKGIDKWPLDIVVNSFMQKKVMKKGLIFPCLPLMATFLKANCWCKEESQFIFDISVSHYHNFVKVGFCRKAKLPNPPSESLQCPFLGACSA